MCSSAAPPVSNRLLKLQLAADAYMQEVLARRQHSSVAKMNDGWRCRGAECCRGSAAAAGMDNSAAGAPPAQPVFGGTDILRRVMQQGSRQLSAVFVCVWGGCVLSASLWSPQNSPAAGLSAGGPGMWVTTCPVLLCRGRGGSVHMCAPAAAAAVVPMSCACVACFLRSVSFDSHHCWVSSYLSNW